MGNKNSVPILKVETKDGHRNSSAKQNAVSTNAEQKTVGLHKVSDSKTRGKELVQGSVERPTTSRILDVKEAAKDGTKKRTHTGKSRNRSATKRHTHVQVHAPFGATPSRRPPPPLPTSSRPRASIEVEEDLEDSYDYSFDNEGMPRLRRRTLSPIGIVQEENEPSTFSRFSNGRVGGLGPRSRPHHLARTVPGPSPQRPHDTFTLPHSNCAPLAYDPIKVPGIEQERSPALPRTANFHTSHLGDLVDSPEDTDNERDTVGSLHSHSDSDDSIEHFFNESLLGSPRNKNVLDNQTVSKLWQAPSGVYVPIVEIRDENIFPEIGLDHSFITEYSFAEDIARVEVMELPEDVHLCVRGRKAPIHSGSPAPETLLRTTQPLPPNATLLAPRPLPLPQSGWSHNGVAQLPGLGPPPKKLEKLDLKAEKRRFRKNSLSSDVSDTISIITIGSSTASALTVDEGTNTIKSKSLMRKKLERRGRKSGTVRPSKQRPTSLHLPSHVTTEEETAGRLPRARSWPLLISKDEGTQTDLPLRRSCGQSLANLFRRMLGMSSKVTPREPMAKSRTQDHPTEGPRTVWDQDDQFSDSSSAKDS